MVTVHCLIILGKFKKVSTLTLNGCYEKEYEGRFEEDQFHGKGVLVYTNGDIYEGNFTLGKRDGKGIFRRLGHFLYDRHWESDRRCGFGYLRYLSKEGKEGEIIYKGEFKDNNMHGKGKLIHFDEAGKKIWVYDGQFYHGRMEGHGNMIYIDGHIETGPFVNDKKHGVFVKSIVGEGLFPQKFRIEYDNDLMMKEEPINQPDVSNYPIGSKVANIFTDAIHTIRESISYDK